MTPNTQLSEEARNYLREIGARGGRACKGTKAAKLRSAKANAAKRRKKESQ